LLTSAWIFAVLAFAAAGGPSAAPVPPAEGAPALHRDPAPDAKAAKHPVSLEAYASSLAGARGQTLLVAIRLSLKKGWHVNSNRPVGPEASLLIPTTVTISATAPATLQRARYPDAHLVKLTFSKAPLAVYTSDNWLLLRLKVKAGKPGRAVIPIQVRYQACSDRLCLRPEALELRLPFEVTRGPTPGPKRHDGIFRLLSKQAKQP
jgi:DsbC/DsbD-like thiol-disulfide interchange protein